MNRVVIQTPVSPELRRKAERVAHEQGYSSLQDAIRMYLEKLASREIQVRLHEQFPAVELSLRAAKRYKQIDEDYEKGRNIFIAEGVQDLMDQLHGTKNPLPYKVR